MFQLPKKVALHCAPALGCHPKAELGVLIGAGGHEAAAVFYGARGSYLEGVSGPSLTSHLAHCCSLLLAWLLVPLINYQQSLRTYSVPDLVRSKFKPLKAISEASCDYAQMLLPRSTAQLAESQL